MSTEKNRQSWNDLSDYYQQSVRISLADVHYGPYGPGEKELRMIGDVRGLDILEIGCGGGQNAVILAKWGARSVTGLDFSEKQLAHARRLASENLVRVHFVLGQMEDLSHFPAKTFDLVVSSHAMDYSEGLDLVFAECGRVLRLEGRLVVCMVHPIQQLVWDALESNDLSKIGCYFADRVDTWSWTDKQGRSVATFETKAPTFAGIVNSLANAGFRIERMEEPRFYDYDYVLNSQDGRIPYRNADETSRKFIEIGRQIPFSLVVCARRTTSVT